MSSQLMLAFLLYSQHPLQLHLGQGISHYLGFQVVMDLLRLYLLSLGTLLASSSY